LTAPLLNMDKPLLSCHTAFLQGDLDTVIDWSLSQGTSEEAAAKMGRGEELRAFSLVFRAIKKRALTDAQQQLDLYCRRYPESLLTAVALADFLHETGSFPQAFQAYEKLIARAPESFYPRYRQLLSTYLSGNASQGCLAFERALRERPWRPKQRWILENLGAALYALDHQFAKSLTLCRDQLQQLLAQPLPAQQKNSSQRLSEENGWRTLVRVNRLLRKAGYTPFPTAGTLLGWQREGKLLPFDKDVDIALPSPCDKAALRKVLLTDRALQMVLPDMGFDSFFSVRDRETGCSCDILIHRLVHDKVHHGWFLPGRPPEEGRLLLFTPYILVEDEWQGERFFRPKDSDLYLRELYGDWRTPEPLFDGVIGPCNLANISSLTLSYAYNNLLNHLKAGHRDRGRALVLAMQQKGERDSLLDAVLTVLDRECG